MPRRHVDIIGALDGWISGMDRLGERVGEHQVAEWRYATERFYDRTQQYVHVLDGNLKTSGRCAVDPHRLDIEGSVTYGGTPECDYAIYEFGRGGNHDALTRGFVANVETFEQAIVDGIAAEIDSWR